MSSLQIKKTLPISAPVKPVWEYLVSPSLIVGCLPGATLTSSADDGVSHVGALKVKLGALTIAYAGTASFVEIDHEAHRVRVEAKGREKIGSGRVAMTMVGQVSPTEEGSAISIQAEVQLAGRIVSMGRGMIDIVTEQMLADFAQCLTNTLTAETSDPESTAPPPKPAEAVDGLALLFRAVRKWLRGVLKRSG